MPWERRWTVTQCLLLTVLGMGRCANHVTKVFTSLSACSENVILPSDQSMLEASSPMDCTRQCSRSDQCSAVNVCPDPAHVASPLTGRPMLQCQLLQIASDEGCDSLAFQQECSYLEQFCLHGEWDDVTQDCVCSEGYVGTRCQRLYKDCNEAFEDGKIGIRDLLVQPLGAPSPFLANCLMFDQTVTLLYASRRYTSCSDSVGIFHLTWEALKYRVGNCSCHCFVGLENLYNMMQQGSYWLKSSVNFGSDWLERYYKASLGNESTQYELSVQTTWSPSTPQLSDGFLSTRKLKFCTFDRDCSGCAAAANHAGWFDPEAGCAAASGFEDALSWLANGTSVLVDFISIEVWRPVKSIVG